MPRKNPVRLVNDGRVRNWVIGTVAGLLTLGALVAGAGYGSLHGKAEDPKVAAWACATIVLVAGIIATSRLSLALRSLLSGGSAEVAGAAIRVLAAIVGYVFVVFSVLTVLDVNIRSLLVGAGVAGVVIGIAAQQSLGNVFAGIVLIMAHPFGIGDHIRIRSGALGGIFEARVVEMSLTYVTLQTEDGPLKIPNSGMLAAGVGQLPMNPPPGA